MNKSEMINSSGADDKMKHVDSSATYRWVVDDVVAKSRPEFVQEGVEESILDELRKLWESKLVANGVLADPAAVVAPAPPLQQQQQAAPAPMLMAQPGMMGAYGGVQYPPSMHYQQIAQYPQFAQQFGMQMMQPRPAGVPGFPGYASVKPEPRVAPPVMVLNRQEPRASMPQPLLGNHQLQDPNRKRKEPEGGIPQHDGPADDQRFNNAGAGPGPLSMQSAAVAAASNRSVRRLEPGCLAAAGDHLQPPRPCSIQLIPQHDGPADNDEAGPSKGDVEADGAGDGEAVAGQDEGVEHLTSDDEEGDGEDNEDDAADFLCAQFEKVQRTKNRWKVAMKDGVFHINGKDYLFRKATGEFNF